MSESRELHTRRIREGLEAIDGFTRDRVNAHDPKFRDWKARVEQSLGELFGKEHDYTKRFSHLRFWQQRVSIGSGPGWASQDQRILENDLARARSTLADALEELPVLSVQRSEGGGPVVARSSTPIPQVIVNVHNMLSQSSEMHITQVIAGLNELALDSATRSQAEAHARELADEVRGQQRWPVLAKSLDALKSMGKSVYDHVALPLLLELIKQQTGVKG